MLHRSTLHLLAWLMIWAGSAWAQSPPKDPASAYPNRPIRLLMPFPAGGSPDALGRTLASQVESQLGQNIVVDNRTGANGIIAYELTAKAAPDGYTLVHATPVIRAQYHRLQKAALRSAQRLLAYYQHSAGIRLSVGWASLGTGDFGEGPHRAREKRC